METSGRLATLADAWIRPGSHAGRAEVVDGRLRMWVGDESAPGGGVHVTRRGRDLYELTFVAADRAPSHWVYLSGDELAQVEFVGPPDVTVELADSLPFGLQATEAGTVAVRDRRHDLASGDAVKPGASPPDPRFERPNLHGLSRASLPKTINRVHPWSEAPMFSQIEYTRWVPGLNPHIRLV